MKKLSNKPFIQQYQVRKIRFLMTSKCNFSCDGCHREGVKNSVPERMSSIYYLFVYETLKEKFGFDTVSLSGGEPLLRNDSTDIARMLKKTGANVIIVTNGSNFQKHPNLGKYIKKIYLSINSLEHSTYTMFTHVDGLRTSVELIEFYKKYYPNVEISLNVRYLKGINNDDLSIRSYLDFIQRYDLKIKFIEELPKSPYYIPFATLQDIIEKEGAVYGGYKKGDGIYYKYKNNLSLRLCRILCSNVYFRKDISECCYYGQIFLTSDGCFKPCFLNEKYMYNILSECKNKESKKVEKKFVRAVQHLGYNCPLIYKHPHDYSNLI